MRIDQLSRICEGFHGERGRFAYEAYRWANKALFKRKLKAPLIQWALTPYGACIAMARMRPGDAVITLHPSLWKPGIEGPLRTLDTMVHELLHVYIHAVLEEGRTGNSSHDNPVWVREILSLSPKLGLPSFEASQTIRKREGPRLLRITPDGSISRRALATWPSSVRPRGYYRSGTLPFSWKTNHSADVRASDD